jgi:geranylgeranyl diphosphate synthase type II
MKTAALIRCACRMGAICARASSDKLEALSAYGENLGLAFQIIDDMLDVTSSPEELGKSTQKDEAAGKLTYPGVFGMGEAGRQAREYVNAAKEALGAFAPEADMLRALADYVTERRS